MATSAQPKIDKDEINNLIRYFRETDYAHANKEIYQKNKLRFEELSKEIFRQCGSTESDTDFSFFYLYKIDPLPEEKESNFENMDSVSRNLHITQLNLRLHLDGRISIDHPDMQYLSGLIYRFGLFDIKQDADQEAAWYRKAADQGHAIAQNDLGDMYCYGFGVPQDYNEAVAWFRKAADQGLADPQCNLGYMYNHGLGVPQDSTEAVAWYRKAADQGHAIAQNNLGHMYSHGLDVPQDYNEAAAWLRKAADQGLADSQYSLGYMYKQGQGVPQDSTEAVAWYRKAAEQGHVGARSTMEEMAASKTGNAAYHLAVVDKNIDGLVSILNENSATFWETFWKHDALRISECDWLQELFFNLLKKEKNHARDHSMDSLIFLLYFTPKWDEVNALLPVNIEWLLEVNAHQLDADYRDVYVLELHAKCLDLIFTREMTDPYFEKTVSKLVELFRHNLLSEDNKLLFADMLVLALFEGAFETTPEFRSLKSSHIETLYAFNLLRAQEDTLLNVKEMITSTASSFMEKGLIKPKMKEIEEKKNEFYMDKKAIKELIQSSRIKSTHERQETQEAATRNHLSFETEAFIRSFEKSNPHLQKLADYLRERAKEESAEYTSPFGFFSAWFGGYSKKEKVEAVTILMRQMMGENVQLTDQQKKTIEGALGQGKLKDVVASPEVQDAIKSARAKHHR